MACDSCLAVEVPGPRGTTGTNGTNGTNGINAFSILTDGFNMPAEGNDTASLLTTDSRWMVAGQKVYVSNAGYMEVRSKADATHVVLRNLENTATGAYSENVPPGTPVAGSQAVSPAGIQGPSGTAGSASGTGLSQGAGAPAAPPVPTNLTHIYYDTTAGQFYAWNIASQIWE
jgi:hypothetical protein